MTPEEFESVTEIVNETFGLLLEFPPGRSVRERVAIILGELTGGNAAKVEAFCTWIVTQTNEWMGPLALRQMYADFAGAAARACTQCNNTGVVLDESTGVYVRCRCSPGLRDDVLAMYNRQSETVDAGDLDPAISGEEFRERQLNRLLVAEHPKKPPVPETRNLLTFAADDDEDAAEKLKEYAERYKVRHPEFAVVPKADKPALVPKPKDEKSEAAPSQETKAS